MTAITLKDPSLFRQQCFINGEWRDAINKEVIAVNNPATNEIIGTIPKMGANETREAIAAAEIAQKFWRKKTAHERAAIMRHWHKLIIENQEDLALLMTSEQGKVIAESRGEIGYAASFIEWFAEEGKRVYGDIIPSPRNDARIVVTKQPIGVCVAITPWNFPAAMITRKAGAALAAGCSIVIKPAGQTPYTALALAELAKRAGIPAGVLSVVTGSAKAIGGEMTSNPIVRKLSFTGSTEVGIELLKQCAPTIKKTSMELGGNAPFIVFDDADIDAAVAGAMLCKFRNAGQTCICANRILVQDGVYDVFAQKLVEAVAKLKLGNGLEPSSTQGPLIDVNAVNKVETFIADATNHGANVAIGGKPHSLGGTFFEPTVLTEVTREMLIAKEEIFGPVAPLIRFKTEDEAIAIANDVEYGLASYFYSRDIKRVWRVGEALEYGMVGINTGLISNEVAPFGGIKSSGLGREGSKYGIDDYLEIKYMCMDIG
jgi:succinate-semialdehyde dehydrogenase / glutarate-semialdehyde dehydrogenase